jgi:hypothetical protein
LAVTESNALTIQHADSRAKKAAQEPVFVIDRGEPAHVLLSIEEYRKLTGAHRNIADWPAVGAMHAGDPDH